MNTVEAVTKCQAIKRSLLDRLGKMQVGEKLPSEPSLAKFFGVSRFTVNKAIGELVADGLVVRKHGRGTFLVRDVTQATVTKEVLLILGKGVANSPGDGFYGPVYSAILEHLEREGHSVLSASADESPQDFHVVQENLQKNKLDGAIIIGRADGSVVDYLIQESIPLVLVDRNSDAPGVGSVGTDNVNGARNATRYLIDQGHRHIAFVCSSLHTSFVERHEGYRQALSEANLPVSDALEITDLDLDTSGKTLRKLLTQSPRPTAVFCGNDPVASRVLRAVRSLGRSVPADVSVVGFDDCFAEHLDPPLTTMRVNRRGMGANAADMLKRLMQHDSMSPDELKNHLPTELIERGSVVHANWSTEARKGSRRQ